MTGMRPLAAGVATINHLRGWRWVVGLAVLTTLIGCERAPTNRGVAPIPATPPIAVDTPPPTYPLELACAGRGGEVVLMLTVGVDGAPSQVRTEASSGRKGLDAAAVAAVRTWRFEPATSRGKPVSAQIRVPVNFTAPVMRPDVCFQFDEEQRRSKQPAATR